MPRIKLTVCNVARLPRQSGAHQRAVKSAARALPHDHHRRSLYPRSERLTVPTAPSIIRRIGSVRAYRLAQCRAESCNSTGLLFPSNPGLVLVSAAGRGTANQSAALQPEERDAFAIYRRLSSPSGIIWR